MKLIKATVAIFLSSFVFCFPVVADNGNQQDNKGSNAGDVLSAINTSSNFVSLGFQNLPTMESVVPSSAESAYVMGPTGLPELGSTFMGRSSEYLYGLGFDGDIENLWLPNESNGQSYFDGKDIVVDAVLTKYAENPDDVLWLMGYSQSAQIIGMAEKELHDAGVPEEYLRIVMLGDPTDPIGGFWPNIYDTLPSWSHPLADTVFYAFGFGEFKGMTSPTDLYQTDTFSIRGDSASDIVHGMNLLNHLSYYGMTPDDFDVTGTQDLMTFHYAEPSLDALFSTAQGWFTDFFGVG